jgi:hypothetical protein
MHAIEAHRALARARGLHYEDHEGALAEAIRCHELARALHDPALCCRALVLQAAVALQRGDLGGAVELIAEAEPHAEAGACDDARAELAAVNAQLNFFAGSYPESLADAGGEEFVLLMPQTDSGAAAAACERLRRTIRDEPWNDIAPGMTLTASAGVATAADASDLEALADLADRRLYEAKRAGRDRVVAQGAPACTGAPWPDVTALSWRA